MRARTAQLLCSLTALGLAAALCFIGNGYQVFLIAMVALTAMVGIGLNVLLGLAGQVSLGQVGFFALGAYAVAVLTMRLGMNFWPALVVAGALAGLVGMALALPALRVAGPYLAMVTIAFGFIVQNGAIEWRSLTGGANGITGVPSPVLAGHVFSTRDIALLALVGAALLLLLFDRLANGSWGRAMRAAQASEIASRSLGLDLVWLRVTAFALSAAAAGLAGGIFAPLSGFIGPSSFGFFQSILFLLVVILGGGGTTAGPLVGAAIVVLLPQLGARFAEYQLLAFGAMLLVVLWLAPDGVVGALTRHLRRGSVARGARATGHWSIGETRGSALVATDLAIVFGGVEAASGISFAAKAGAITSVIGPNGAGKSTLLNLLSGFYRPDRGAVSLGDQVLSGRPAHAIARAGIARSFQTSQLFSGLTVGENVIVGLRGHRLGSLFPISAMRAKAERREAAELLAFVGYGGDLDRRADDLPHIDKRLVEIARALAMKPRVLLLDEPAAGLGEADTARLASLLRRIAAMNVVVVLVEHDMGLVMEVSDHVLVLDAGRSIAADTPANVQRDPAVIKAYLGEQGLSPQPRVRPLVPAQQPALAIEALCASYGAAQVLHSIDLTITPGEFVAVLGANGAGKSTLMRAASGLLRPIQGSIRLGGIDVSALPAHHTVRKGLVLVPEGRQVFPELSVIDNLRLGAYSRRGADLESEIERLFTRFSQLRERRHQRAGLLSGGEQQMLALARALIAAPRILLLDEPSLGLAPAIIARLFTSLAELRDEGVTLLLVDQMTGMALALADRGYVLEGGRVLRSGAAAELAADDALRQAYLGGAAP
jgi:branched-chain amino acid transport system ATP-binding protein/branched-chain amino acid transport system permease protein